MILYIENFIMEDMQMNRISKKAITLLLAMMIILVMPMKVKAASTKGPSNGSCYIKVIKSEDDSTDVFFPQLVQNGGKVKKVSGLSYDKKTNTLTIKNMNKPKWSLDINEMGSDFKLKVVGTNHLARIRVWGFGYAGCMEMTGSGTLTLNKSQTNEYAITMMAEQSQAVLKVGKKVKLTAYAGKDTKESIAIFDSTVKDTKKSIIFSNGASTKKVKKEKDIVYKAKEAAYKINAFGYTSSWYFTMILLTKNGEEYLGCQFPGDAGFEYHVCKYTGEVDEEMNLPCVEYLETVESYEKAGYQGTVDSYVYSYKYPGKLVLKEK